MLKKLAAWILAGTALFAVSGFLILPPILKSLLISKLSELLHREVAIREIHVNPFALSVGVTGFSIMDRGNSGPFLSFEELYLNLESVSLFKGGPVLSDIQLKAPSVVIIRNEDLTYNFSDLLDSLAPKPSVETQLAAESKPFWFSLNNIQILGGSIDFKDRPKHAHHTIRELTIAIPFLSNMSTVVDIRVEPLFQATINGAPFVLHGKSKPFSDSHETQLDIQVHDIDIPKYVEYVPTDLKFKIPGASLDSKLAISFIQYKEKGPALIVAGQVALNKLAITDLVDNPVLRVPMLEIKIDTIDVFARKVRLDSISLQSPEVDLQRDKTGILNLMTLVPDLKEQTTLKEDSSSSGQKTEGPTSTIEVEVSEFKLANGTITFSDHSLEKPFQTTVQALNVTLLHFSTVLDKATGVEVSFTTNVGETFTHTGGFTVLPLGAEGSVSLNKIPLIRYMPYLPPTLLVDVAGGMLDVSTKYRYRKVEGGDHTALSSLTATLHSVRVKRKGENTEFLKMPVLWITDTDIDMGARTVTLGELSTRQGMVHVTRSNNGTLNLTNLVAPVPVIEKTSSPPVAAAAQRAEALPWVVRLKKLMLDRYAITIEDHMPTEPATLVMDPITLTAERLSTDKTSSGTAHLRLTLNKTSAVSVNGSLGLNPISAKLNIDAKTIDLVPLQPYFTNTLNIVVTSGALSTIGILTVITAGRTDPAIGFDGNATLTKLATVDKATSEDFTKWESLTINGIHVATAPLRLEIKDFALAVPITRVIVNPDGTLNLQNIVAREKKAAEKETASDDQSKRDANAPHPQEAISIKIDTVRLDDGTISFLDRHLTPNYAAKLTQLSAKISGLTSEEGKPAEFVFSGKLDDTSPFEATGKLNPLAKALYADLKIDFRDMDLSAVTPYSDKYAGYTIEKGKLSLDLKYLIDNQKLEATNKVFIDQFTFGEQVESPSATTLPVKLAISLLKDRKGEIRLDFPVAGSLDSPEFSVWGVILQVITNLLTKAATSPFALLGSLTGGGEELSYVAFAPGTASLDGSAEDKLKTLAKGITERPTLKLEVVGRMDPEKDKERYTRVLFERKVKAEKLTELVKQGKSVASLDQITIASDEYPAYLAKAYKKETFPKPKNFFGLTKDLPVPEMEQLMLAHTQVTDDDLRQLAIQRAHTVKDYLVETGKVESERIFLVEKRAGPQDTNASLEGSRVDFMLQ